MSPRRPADPHGGVFAPAARALPGIPAAALHSQDDKVAVPPLAGALLQNAQECHRVRLEPLAKHQYTVRRVRNCEKAG